MFTIEPVGTVVQGKTTKSFYEILDNKDAYTLRNILTYQQFIVDYKTLVEEFV